MIHEVKKYDTFVLQFIQLSLNFQIKMSSLLEDRQLKYIKTGIELVKETVKVN